MKQSRIWILNLHSRFAGKCGFHHSGLAIYVGRLKKGPFVSLSSHNVPPTSPILIHAWLRIHVYISVAEISGFFLVRPLYNVAAIQWRYANTVITLTAGQRLARNQNEELQSGGVNKQHSGWLYALSVCAVVQLALCIVLMLPVYSWPIDYGGYRLVR